MSGKERPFAELLRGARIAARLTQEELAERADMSVPALSRAETGKTTPQRRYFRRLASALELSPDETPERYRRFEEAWREQRTRESGHGPVAASRAGAAGAPGPGAPAAPGPDAPPDSPRPARSAADASRATVRRSRRIVPLAMLLLALGLAALFLARQLRGARRPGTEPLTTPPDARPGGRRSTPRPRRRVAR